ncbi:MAG: amidohydrolase [Steroidobacteraceae bacterium]
MRAHILGVVIACCCVPTAGTAQARQADIVFLNGAVYTVDAAQPTAAAIALAQGRIVYVGTDDTARQYVGRKTRVIDLQGRTLLPGFQDSHLHPGDVPNPGTALDLGGLKTREDIFERIHRFAASHPGKAWIVGTGWDEAAFLPSGQPTREMLDALVPDRPAFLTNNSLHMGWSNSLALAKSGVAAGTPDPPNGRIERDEAGRPTGVLQEAAMDVVRGVIPPLTTDEMAEDLAAALNELKRNGITAFMEALSSPALLQAYLALARDGRIDQRAAICQYYDPALGDDRQVVDLMSRRKAFTDTSIDANCVKIVLDGAYGSHTVALLQPYSDEPEKFGHGKLFLEPDRLKRIVTRLDAEGFQIHVHALGDGAVRASLDAFAEARRVNGVRDSRHTLAHLAMIDAADLPRFKALGVVANMSPLWNRGDPWETVFATKMFGPERSANLYLTRSLLDAQATLVWGSDWPVTGMDPLDGIETAVTRRYPGGKNPDGVEDTSWIPAQRVTLPEAVVAYTASGAYLLHDEAERGTIAVGKLADLVVLSRNLFATDPLAIHAIEVDMTLIGGHVVFERR